MSSSENIRSILPKILRKNGSPSVYRTQRDQLLIDHVAPVFVAASQAAYKTSGDWKISNQQRRELMALFGLEPSEVTALAYPGERHAEDNHRVIPELEQQFDQPETLDA